MEAIPRDAVVNDWLSVLFLACLILVTLAKYIFPSKFKAFSLLLANNRFLLGQRTETRLATSFNFFLTAVQVISFSIFIFIICRGLSLMPHLPTHLLLVRISLFFILFYSVKILVEKMIAVLVNGESSMANFHYFKLSYRNFLSIALLPIDALLIYTFNVNTSILLVLIIIFALTNVTIIFASLRPHTKLIARYPFYFILYICALEIAPHFAVYKLIGSPIEF